ncbi:MAG: hypothetical protein KatS3mg083_114 [Candidatus Dojkabacteria bacterium]|nr:MAG: hypothetical protein KatS3mg083_114 [Candidatus Dojkabacteria bacterium]
MKKINLVRDTYFSKKYYYYMDDGLAHPAMQAGSEITFNLYTYVNNRGLYATDPYISVTPGNPQYGIEVQPDIVNSAVKLIIDGSVAFQPGNYLGVLIVNDPTITSPSLVDYFSIEVLNI